MSKASKILVQFFALKLEVTKKKNSFGQKMDFTIFEAKIDFNDL